MASASTSGSDLRALRNRLAGMTRPPFRTVLAQLCANAALKQVADEFNGSHGPDGNPWEPLKYRRGASLGRARGGRRRQGPRRAGKPLLDTGRLRASFAVEPTDGGFKIGTAVGYAGYHQFGTSRGIPARPMLPGAGIPPAWSEAFAKEINRAVARQLRGGGA